MRDAIISENHYLYGPKRLAFGQKHAQYCISFVIGKPLYCSSSNVVVPCPSKFKLKYQLLILETPINIFFAEANYPGNVLCMTMTGYTLAKIKSGLIAVKVCHKKLNM